MNTISAQERKRQIRERRRKSQQSSQRNGVATARVTALSAVESNAGTLGDQVNRTDDNSSEVNKRGTSEISGSFEQNLITVNKKRSVNSSCNETVSNENEEHTHNKHREFTSDFPSETDLDYSRSHQSSKASTLFLSQPSASFSNFPSRDGFSKGAPGNSRKKLFSNESNASQGMPTEKSLFSTVMKRSSLSPKPDTKGDNLTGERQEVDVSSNAYESRKEATIQTNSNHVTFTAGLTTSYSSPDKKMIMFNKHSSPAKSPGGYDIMKALEGVSDITRSWYYEENLKDDDEEENKVASGTEQDGADNDADPVDEWHIADVQFKAAPSKADFSNDANNNSETAHARRTKNDLFDDLDAENDALEKAGNSPLHSPEMNIIEETKMAIETDGFQKVNAHSYQQPIEIGVIDWSLKKRVRMEFFPGRCLPGTLPQSFGGSSKQGNPGGKNTRQSQSDEGLMQKLAVHYLSKGGIGDDENSFYVYGRQPSIEESTMAKWIAGTMYYQYPSVHPLPQSLLLETTNTPEIFSKKGSVPPRRMSDSNMHTSIQRSKPKEAVQKLSSHIRGPHSLLHRVRLPGVGGLGGLGASMPPTLSRRDRNPDTKVAPGSSSVATVSGLLDQRRREWQEAFRSMFNSWRSKLRDLERHFLNVEKTTLKHHPKRRQPTPEEVSRCSFYSILPDQVILFRGGLAKSTDIAGADGQWANHIAPVIVFSSTSVEFRSKLKAMGVQLKLLTQQENGANNKECINEFFEHQVETQDLKLEIVGVDTEVNAELEALRSTHGAGAEVSVSTKKAYRRVGAPGDIAKSLPPLYVSGDDDCAAVYEILLNTFGLSVSFDNNSLATSLVTKSPCDVPLLLCRSIGQCMHTSLRSLSVSSRRDCAYYNQTKATKTGVPQHQQSEQQITSFMELRGPILPCALRDMTCASINLMLLDKQWQDRSLLDCDPYNVPTQSQHFEDENGNENNKEEGIGSHHVAIFLQAHDGERPVLQPKSTGSSSSSFFNGSNVSLVPEQMEDTSNDEFTAASHECNPGEYLNVIVWDVSRPSTLAYKTFSAV